MAYMPTGSTSASTYRDSRSQYRLTACDLAVRLDGYDLRTVAKSVEKPPSGIYTQPHPIKFYLVSKPCNRATGSASCCASWPPSAIGGHWGRGERQEEVRDPNHPKPNFTSNRTQKLATNLTPKSSATTRSIKQPARGFCVMPLQDLEKHLAYMCC